MRNSSRNVPGRHDLSNPANSIERMKQHCAGGMSRYIALLIAMVFLTPFVLAQGSPKVTSVDPATGKVNDTVSVIGENLGKGSVSAVFLSDDKNDSKASVVDQAAEKITIKIPQVKAGSYNISIQTGDKIMILPVRFEVQ
jgi:hypothetical protein